MKSTILVALALVAVAVALPLDKESKVTDFAFDLQPDGKYGYRFESDDGIKRQENSELKTVVDKENQPNTFLIVRGFYEYLNQNGGVEKINYVADENGFRAEGSSIPKNSRR